MCCGNPLPKVSVELHTGIPVYQPQFAPDEKLRAIPPGLTHEANPEIKT